MEMPTRVLQLATSLHLEATCLFVKLVGMLQVGSHLLPRAVFDVPIRRDILHRVVRWQRAKAQQVGPAFICLGSDGPFCIDPDMSA